METNKITATIEIEIEDDRDSYRRCFYPVTKKLIEDNICLEFGETIYFDCSLKIKDIKIEESSPISEWEKSYQKDCVMISDAISENYGMILEFEKVKHSGFLDKRYNDLILRTQDLDMALTLWNWRQGCSNYENLVLK